MAVRCGRRRRRNVLVVGVVCFVLVFVYRVCHRANHVLTREQTLAPQYLTQMSNITTGKNAGDNPYATRPPFVTQDTVEEEESHHHHHQQNGTAAPAQDPHQFTFTGWAEVQAERVRRLRAGCSLEHGHSSSLVFSTRSIVDKDTRLVYCPVEKSASTFLRRFMYSLQNRVGSREIVSPFHVPIAQALNHKFPSPRTLSLRGETVGNGADSTRFVVVREPFSRLYSAYVDKVLVPNEYFWRVWNLNIVSRFRQFPSERARRCGHDVTFGEFVKYVISTLHKTNPHLIPVSKLCASCASNFTVIGRMETLKWDFQYLLELLNVRVSNFSADTLTSDVSTDAILDSTYSAFTFYRSLNSCVSLHETCQRLWRKMQLRGIISEELRFPLSEQEAENISASDMVQFFEKARRNSTDSEKLHRQKENALKNAYAEVSSQDVRTLRDIYRLDFDLFGYDKNPGFIG